MRRLRQLVIVFALLAFFGCEGTTFYSSVPRYPVYITIDTRIGEFVHFVPTALNTYIIVDAEGIHYRGTTYPRPVTSAYGYGGVVLYIDMIGCYNAWDLACPYCAEHGKRVPCTVDGGVVTCPECGEEYKVFDGSAMPSKRLSKETLLRLNLTKSGDIIQVNQ